MVTGREGLPPTTYNAHGGTKSRRGSAHRPRQEEIAVIVPMAVVALPTDSHQTVHILPEALAEHL